MRDRDDRDLRRPATSFRAALLATVLAAVPAPAQPPATPPVCVASAPRALSDASTDSASRAAFHAALDPCMRDMHAQMHAALTAPSGDADVLFATGMIPHHQGAVDMARQLLLYGRDPALRAFARNVIAEQQAEIDMLRAWVTRHASPVADRPPSAASPAFPPIADAHSHTSRPTP